MWTSWYWGNRYWGLRYWATGGTVITATPRITITVPAQSRTITIEDG